MNPKRNESLRPQTRSEQQELSFPALEVKQGPASIIYSFAVDGKQLPLFAAVSRVHRDEASKIRGYQRPEVLSHIGAIRRYIESENAMIPNALVIAFDSRVTFDPDQPRSRGAVRTGTLTIPINSNQDDEDKPGWIVDGQQRFAAIRDAQVSSFPICVTAFIAESDAEQRSQFILVNSTKPLPKGLIHELLPGTNGILPPALEIRRFPSALVDRLNYDDKSPLFHMIHTPTTPDGVIKDNSMLRMVENSLSDGALYRFRHQSSANGNVESMLKSLKGFWGGVEAVFPGAWGLAPRHSRLMHGVGIVSLGFVMDVIAEKYGTSSSLGMEEFRTELERIKDVCHWTSGSWDFGDRGQRRWNDLQNTPRDIQLLTDFLLQSFRARSTRRTSTSTSTSRRERSSR